MTTLALVVAVALALAFDVTNGFHDSANSVAALVATRAATPMQALAVGGVGNFAGPLLAGTAVADTVGGVVDLPLDVLGAAVGAALSAAIVWNLITWRFGLPTSSSHALIGGLVGATAIGGWGGIPVGRIRRRQTVRRRRGPGRAGDLADSGSAGRGGGQSGGPAVAAACAARNQPRGAPRRVGDGVRAGV